MFRTQSVGLYNIVFPREQDYLIVSEMGWMSK